MDRLRNFLQRSRIKRLLLRLLIAGVILSVVAGFSRGLLLNWLLSMPGESWQGSLPPPTEDDREATARMAGHVRVLAGEIGERHFLRMDALESAARYIEDRFTEYRYVPRQQDINGKGFRNVYVDLHGTTARSKILVIGAHYDSTWLTPGADDNASGVAILLELARRFAGRRQPLTLRFIAFVNEERPFFGTPDMGSRVSAEHSRSTGEDIVGMFSLEMLGYYSDRNGSQRYPDAIRDHYPDTGNFISFIGNVSSRPLLRQSLEAFRTHARFPSEGLSAPQFLVRSIRRSDHSSYWANGYRAIMITDTANYRNPHYHRYTDTPETLDYQRMAVLATGLASMIEKLAAGHSD